MKKLMKYTYLALVGMVALLASSCSDSYKYDGRGSWDASDGYANIYFEITDSTLELDPADATIAKVKVSRRNTQGAVTVPFKIEENTDDVFTVGQAVFADGQDETEVTLSFPNAQIGKPYTLKMSLDDPTLVSKYSAGAIYTIEITRVKWNDVGFYYADEAKTKKVEGYAMYTDDIITGFYGVGNYQYPVRIQERDDMKGYFRVIGLYDNYLGGNYSDPSMTTYLYIDATDPTHVYIPELFESNMDLGSGHVLVYSIAGLRIGQGREKELTDADFGTYENGKITFPKGGLLIGEVGYNNGGLYGTNNSGLTSFVLNPDLDLHDADMTSDEDFTWELVNDQYLFISNQLKTQKDGVALYKGTCINTEGKCDERFAKEYGTAYKIASPYADGFDIYFAVNDKGEVTLPEKLKYQQTGLDAVGTAVYAVLSTAASTFTENVITLKMAFQSYPDEDGNYTEYGSAEEILQFITWTPVGTGTYTYDFLGWWLDPEGDDEYEQIVDAGYTISQRDDDETIYKIEDWMYGGELVFKWDKTTNNCVVSPSATGYVHPAVGMFYASDVAQYFEDESYYDYYPCVYNPETKTFEFLLMYYYSSDYFGVFNETFEVDWTAPAASKKAQRAQKATNSQKSLKASKKIKGMAAKNKAPRFGNGVKKNVKTERLLTPFAQM